MNKGINEIRLFLFTCSGEDNYILKRCKTKIQVRFAAIGFFVLLIFLGCFISASFFTYSLFNGAIWASLPIGIFWGAMVVNIYLLLLHTISPAIIPLSSKKKRKKDNEEEKKVSFLSLSMFLRLLLMMLLAIIISQPLNVYFLSSSVSTSIEKHKLQERVKLYTTTNQSLINNELEFFKDFNRKTSSKIALNETNVANTNLNFINTKISGDSLFLKKTNSALKKLDNLNNHWSLSSKQKKHQTKLLDEINTLLDDELKSDSDFINQLNDIKLPLSIKTEFDDFKTEITSLINDKNANYKALNSLLDKSNFYVKTIQLLLFENPLSWIITILVCLVFLIPIGLKYKARDISAKMFLADNKEDLQLIKLRQELINTTNFNWLEKKIKKIDAKEIRTTDYYFQRMLIEHKIILHEYDIAKKQYSDILTDRVKTYNKICKERLKPFLEKLKKINNNKYNEINNSINTEYKDELLVKYEYWIDSPFRTKRKQVIKIVENQIGLLDFVYMPNTEKEI
ncbi:DUF4407 domain-containing protein [Flavobacterium eburneipallidum]|uniref:DUF4407 domain-containing protein n=1 Tax=Flavobacterium eburneipallidum TaxID=3003263 RepID=UPI00248322FA|nr:DUF4407 domain-containing protein [Flavobacterium eburneipallidum]